METLPIFSFRPILKATVWGGRRIGTMLGGVLPGEGPFGESWELVDLPSDQSVVLSQGPFEGRSLGELRAQHRRALLGDAPLLDGRFPLLFKFLDAAETLSVQVHPDADACARIGGGARPKTEAWYIIDCEPGALLYAGLKRGVDRPAFEEALQAGAVESLLRPVAPRPGDFVFLPAGTVHAIGGGILLAEIQQASDTTYRVFDWNRVGLDGKPRKLHPAEALESIAFGDRVASAMRRPPSGLPGIACDHFVMESIALGDAEEIALGEPGMTAVMGVAGEGEAHLRAGAFSSVVRRGQTRLVPAERQGDIAISSNGSITLLAVRVP